MIDEQLLHNLFGSMDDILEEERQTTPVETPMETDDKEANGNNHMLLPYGIFKLFYSNTGYKSICMIVF